MIAMSEELALVSRRDAATDYRFVPLVREFLRARLSTLTSDAEIQQMHLRLGQQFEGTNWRISATHYQRSGDPRKASDVVSGSLDRILGEGQYKSADDLLAGDQSDGIVRGILRSRLLLQLGATDDAVRESTATLEAAESIHHEYRALAAQNAASIAYGARTFDLVAELAQRAVDLSDDPVQREMSSAYVSILSASSNGSLPAIARQFERLLASQTRRGQLHYAAITNLNLAQCLVWLDLPEDAILRATEAERLLKQSSRGYEAVSVRLAEAHAHAQVGRWDDALRSLAVALDSQHPEGEVEAALEAASVVAWYGPRGLASEILAKVDRSRLPTSWAQHWRVLDLWLVSKPDLACRPRRPALRASAVARSRCCVSMARFRGTRRTRPRRPGSGRRQPRSAR